MSVKVTSEKKELGSILKCHCRNKSPTCADCSDNVKKLSLEKTKQKQTWLNIIEVKSSSYY